MDITLYHISDLRIRSDRSKEFTYVFDYMIDHIVKERQTKKNRVYLIICGNIFDCRGNLPPADIELYISFINKLTENKIETIIITGKHDYSPFGSKYPICSVLLSNTNTYVKYLPLGIYSMDGLKIYVCNDKSEIPDKKVLFDDDKNPITSVLIYNGNNSSTISRLMRICDIGLLGGSNTYKICELNTNAIWCGSLLQQTYDDKSNKGFIEWNLSIRDHTFHRIKNTVGGFLHLIYENNKLIYPTSLSLDINPTSGIYIDTKDCDPNIIKEYIKVLQSHFKSCPIKYAYVENDISIQELFLTHIRERKIDKTYEDKLLQLHDKQLSISSPSRKINTNKWYIKYLQWSNVLRYGENNFINFEKCSKLIGIMGNNGIGKSTIIDILVYILFNETIRGNYKSIIRKGCSKLTIDCIITVNDTNYIIKRNGRKVTVSNCGSTNTTEIYEYIRSLIGSYEDFIDTHMMAYEMHSNFSVMTPAKITDRLMTIFGINAVKSIITNIKLEMKVIRTKLKELRGMKSLPISNEQLQQLIAEKDTIDQLLSSEKKKYNDLMNIKDTINIMIEDISYDDALLQLSELKKLKCPSIPKIDKMQNIINLYKSTDAIDKLRNTVIEKKDQLILSMQHIPLEITQLQERSAILLSKIIAIPFDISSKFGSLSSLLHINSTEKSIDDTTNSLRETKDILGTFEPLTIDVSKTKAAGYYPCNDGLYYKYMLDGEIMIREEELHLLELDIKKMPTTDELKSKEDKLCIDIVNISSKLISCDATDIINVPIIDYEKEITNLNIELEALRNTMKKEYDTGLMQMISHLITVISDIKCTNCKIQVIHDTHVMPLKSYISELKEEVKQNIYKEQQIKEIQKTINNHRINIKILENNERIQHNRLIYKSIESMKDEITEVRSLQQKRITKLNRIDEIKKLLNYNTMMITYVKYRSLSKLLEQQKLKKSILEYMDINNENDNINKQLADIRLQLRNLIDSRDNINADIANCDQLLEFISNKIKYDTTQQQIKKLELYTDNLSHNLEQRDKLHKVMAQLEVSKQSITSMESKLSELVIRITTMKELLVDTQQQLNTIDILAEEFKVLSLYNKCITTMPTANLKSMAELVVSYMNNILINIVNFKIAVSLDKNGHLIFELVDKDGMSTHLSLASEFQKFIADFVMRISLSKLLIPASFFIIDEGFGMIDSKHAKNVIDTLNILSSKFSWIIIMGHRDEIMSCCTNFIQIIENEHTSILRHGNEVKTDIKVSVTTNKFDDSVFSIINGVLHCKICKKDFKSTSETFMNKHVNTLIHKKRSA